MTTQKHWEYKIYREKTINRIKQKIKLLGDRFPYDELFFLNTRLILAIIVFLALFFFSKYGYFLAPISLVLFYILFELLVLDYPIKKRAKKLEEDAIFFFEVLGLTLESTRNLKKAIDLTATNIDSELAQEFQKTLAEIKLGKSFTESLVSMKERIPSESINNIILTLTESSILGNSITETLNNQLDYLREQQLLEIKGEITKLPTKISIISVLFFLPIMLLIILSPLLVEFLLG